MGKHTKSKFNILALTLFVLALGPFLGFSVLAQVGESRVRPVQAKKITQADREAAAERFKAAKAASSLTLAPAAVAVQGGTPDYFGVANWANSPILQKFMDKLPGLGPANANLLGQYIPVAKPDVVTYPGSDYYEISLVEYNEQMHSQLPATRLRGYVQTNLGTNTAACGAPGQPACTLANNTLAPDPVHYLGPTIVSQKDRPVRIKFTNNLPTGVAGKLFLPVDQTIMGAGPGPNIWNGTQKADLLCARPPGTATPAGCFAENRGDIHLHGGRTPWISDGTPHQWITPAAESTSYRKGMSVYDVPDMPAQGDGSQTYYFTNQQSARLMFYHDHAWGITRLNVYAGEAAGYVITDPAEQQLQATGAIPPAADTIPLIIQDKTFVDAANILATDPTWNWGTGALTAGGTIRTPKTGDLWWPHVYVPAQNPYDFSGVNPWGRWAYGPWFWPPTTGIQYPPVANPYYDPACNPANPPYYCQPPEMPGTPNASWGAEAFMDVPVVNGTVFPTITLDPKAYRLRILNASHDRFWNLQLYRSVPIVAGLTVTNPGSGYTSEPLVTITNAAGDTAGKGATAKAIVDLVSASPTRGQVVGLELITVGSGYTSAPSVTIAPPTSGTTALASAAIYSAPTEVGMVPAVATAGFPSDWPIDGREGGVPDPETAGPDFLQIGTEGGFLPRPVVVPNQPVGWNGDPTTFNAGNVDRHALLLGPAERADVIVDFSNYEGKTLILYSDAPAAFPARDPRLDYYTNAVDLRDTGGVAPPQPGFGPNTRTIMQIVVNAGEGTPFHDTLLNAAFTPELPAEGVFAASQEPIIVGQAKHGDWLGYDGLYAANPAFPNTYPFWGIGRIQDNTLSFETVAGDATTLSVPMRPKAIQDEMGEVFDEYGRMSAKIGLELPMTGAQNQNFILQNFIDPATEIVNESVTRIAQAGDGTQIWKITHNGVDTHPVHFHIFDVQLINRVGWDGAIRLPEPNEMGWKDTIRISPLEDTIVAIRPVTPRFPFGIPDSIRPLAPALPLGATAGFTGLDPTTGEALVPPVSNAMVNFGWEYVWHCHILSHEEADMMRPIIFQAARALAAAPVVGLTRIGGTVTLAWTDATPVVDPNNPANFGNPQNEIGFRIQRRNGTNGAWTTLATALANQTTYADTTAGTSTRYYRVVAFNAAGDSPSAAVQSLNGACTPTLSVNSATFTGTGGNGSVNVTVAAGCAWQAVSNALGWASITSGASGTGNGTVQYSVALNAGIARTGTLTIAGRTFTINQAALLLAQMTSPAPGSTLTSASTTFTWTAGTGVTEYQIWFGSTVGGFDLGSPGILTTTTYTANNLPGNGGTLYVRLWSSLGGGWYFVDYTYTNPSLRAVMLSPTQGSTLPGASVAFTWTAGTGVSQYQIWFGTTPGGFDLGSPGILTTTTYTPTNLPVGNVPLYVRLWSLLGGVWQFNDYTYAQANLGMVSPVPGTTLAGASISFTWAAMPGASEYQIWFGTTTGGFELGSPGILTTTSYTAGNVPVNGGTLYVRLWSLVGAVWQFSDFTYTEATLTGTMLSPAQGTTLAGTSIPFTWSTGSGVTGYQIWFGSALGLFDLGSPGILTTTSYTATLPPATGATLYVRLWSEVGGGWQYIDYAYTH